MSAVVDASVILKRLISEDYSRQARAMVDDNFSQGQPLFAPPLLASEIANALYQRTRRQSNTISISSAERALSLFLRLPIIQIAPVDLYTRATTFARTHGLRATYDSQYVVLADILHLQLWTADERLVQALSASAPWVKWIGDYPLTST
jgi:predicted nucleic acid-binding protein